MRLTTTFGWLAALFMGLSIGLFAQTTPESSPFIDPRDTLRRQLLDEQRRMVDPETGDVPVERLQAARERVLSTRQAGGSTQSGIPSMTWQERGPQGNAEVTAVLIDPADPTQKKVWVGLAAGGIWFTNDITSSSPAWYSRGDNLAGQRISSLVADPTNVQVMYAGTGELNYYTSTGIWKTTDGGNSWSLLASTVPNTTGNYPSIGRAFEATHRLAVNASGHVFVASRFGVLKSTDGGTTWQTILAPNQGIGFGSPTGQSGNDLVSDLEIASDGVVYAAFWPSRLFKSTNTAATNWAEITPTGAPTGDRTELGVAVSTSGAGQVLYAITRAYNNVNYSQDVRWFKKSTDAGLTWTDVPIPIPTNGGSSHFTSGEGYRYLTLTVHPTNANLVFAGSYALMRTIDGGMSWTNLTEPSGSWLTYHRSLAPISGSNAVLHASQRGVYWLADGANTSVAAPTGVKRSNDIRAGTAYTVAMRGSPGSNYFLVNIQPQGVVTMTTPPDNGIASSLLTLRSTSPSSMLFIDSDEPTIQIAPEYSNIYVFNGTTSSLLYSANTGGLFIADYDSQANTLYAYTYENGQHTIRRTTGVGTSPTSTTFALTGFTDRPTYLKLSDDRTGLFAGSFGGKLFRITGITQPSPTITRIDDGAFGQVAVSSIDIGATDNQLLVTVSNYGSPSVWYTLDGGGNWINKDLLSHGLPDVPVWTAMFNSQNRQQVLLGTELGIWTTNNITATNPGWEVAPGFPLLRVNQLRYRASDGKLAATTAGRGIWTTDYFAIPYTLPTVTLTSVSTNSLCSGSTFDVSFSTSGTFGPSNQFEVWLSDANGNFTAQRRIGSGTSSPVSATLPSGYNSLPYGTGYQVKVMSTNAEVESNLSAAMTVGNLNSVTIYDRAENTWGAYVCTGAQVTLSARVSDTYYSPVTANQYVWAKDGVIISGASSPTLTATQAGMYSVTAIQASCAKGSSQGYNLNLSNSLNWGYNVSSSSPVQCAGSAVQMRAIYPSDVATYQWQRNGVAITGATATTYAATESGTYGFILQDVGCARNISLGTYTFGSAISAIAYRDSEADSIICATSTAQSYMYISNSAQFNAYQWYRDNKPISGETRSYVYGSGPGEYYAIVRQGVCSAVTNRFSRKLGASLVSRINYVGSTSLCTGESRQLQASYLPYGYYQWQRDGVDIVGATSTQYSVTASGSYTYRVSAYNNQCASTSDPVVFMFGQATVPVLSMSSTGEEFCGSSYINVADRYINNPPFQNHTFQWQRNGADLPGETNSSVYATAEGLYTLRATKGTCTGVSKGVYKRVGLYSGVTARAITSSDACVNGVVVLSTNTYNVRQWKRDGVLIPGATATQYYATQSGRYTVSATSGNCTAESNVIDVKIGEPTAATLTGGAVVNAGQATYLPISFAGPAPWSVTLSNGQSVGGIVQNPYSISVAPAATTTYALSAMANACGTGTASGSAVVTVGSGNADVSLDMVVSSRTPRVGEVVSYSVLVSNAGPQEAVGVQVQSRLPVGTSFAQAVSPEVTYSNGIINIAAGNVPVNATMVYVFQATITDPGTLVTAAQVTNTSTPDPDSQPNSGTGDGQDDATQIDLRTADRSGPLMASANPNQVPLPQLRTNQPAMNASAVELSLQVSLDKLLVNTAQQEVVAATVTVRNRGGLTATGVAVRVALPNGTLAPASQAGWQAVDAQTITGYLSPIAPGGSATLQLLWRPSAAGTLKAQVMQVSEPTVGAVPGNGYEQGEKDEAQASIRVR